MIEKNKIFEIILIVKNALILSTFLKVSVALFSEFFAVQTILNSVKVLIRLPLESSTRHLAVAGDATRGTTKTTSKTSERKTIGCANK